MSHTLTVYGLSDEKLAAISRFVFSLKGLEDDNVKLQVNGEDVTRPPRLREQETYSETMDRLRKREGLS